MALCKAWRKQKCPEVLYYFWWVFNGRLRFKAQRHQRQPGKYTKPFHRSNTALPGSQRGLVALALLFPFHCSSERLLNKHPWITRKNWAENVDCTKNIPTAELFMELLVTSAKAPKWAKKKASFYLPLSCLVLITAGKERRHAAIGFGKVTFSRV